MNFWFGVTLLLYEAWKAWANTDKTSCQPQAYLLPQQRLSAACKADFDDKNCNAPEARLLGIVQWPFYADDLSMWYQRAECLTVLSFDSNTARCCSYLDPTMTCVLSTWMTNFSPFHTTTLWSLEHSGAFLASLWSFCQQSSAFGVIS